MATQIGDIILYLQQLGVYDYFLPFLLIFAIIFAILEKTKILGGGTEGPKTNINVVVSAVIGLLLVVQQNIVSIINSFLPRASLIIIIILVAMLVISLVGGGTSYSGGIFSIAVIFILLALVWAVSPDLGFNLNISENTRNVIIIVAIIILIMAFMTRKPSTQPKSGLERFTDLMGGFKDNGGRKI